MTLAEYIEQHNLTVSEFARRAKLSQPYVWQIVNGERPAVGKKAAEKIEAATNGAVTRLQMLYPEVEA